MHRVMTVGGHGETLTEETFTHEADASIAYCKTVLRKPEAHVRWVGDPALPTLRPHVYAERFGNPCEQPCCVPLAKPWPEFSAAEQ